mgnify:CR=1 FL=1
MVGPASSPAERGPALADYGVVSMELVGGQVAEELGSEALGTPVPSAVAAMFLPVLEAWQRPMHSVAD